MGDDSQFDTRRAGAGGANDFARLFGQMMLMPFSTFAYSINMLLQMMQGMQGRSSQGFDAAGGAVAQPSGGGGSGGYAGDVGEQTFRQKTTRTEERRKR